MQHAAHFRIREFSVLLLLAMFVFPPICSAQFDTGSLKRKAAKALKGGDEKKDESSNQETTDDENVSVDQITNSATSVNAADVIRDGRYAIEGLSNLRSVPQGLYGTKKEAQNFYEKCKTADYPNLRTKINQAVAADPSVLEREQYSYDEVMTAFPEHFAGLTKEYLIGEINNSIEIAYAEKAKGASRAGTAVDAAEAALLVADGILLVTPDNAKVQAVRGDAQAALESMGAAREAVYSGSFHKDNAGKIVFSKNLITAGQETPAAMSSSFTANDNIYGMMYFKSTFKEVTDGSSYGWTKLFVDGNEKAGYDFKLTDDKAANAWLRSEIIPDPAVSTTRGAAIFTKAISELSPRRHTILVQTLDNSMQVLAEGEFELDCSSGLDRIADVNKQLGNKSLSAVSLPAAAMSNPGLEKEFAAALKDWPEKTLKVIITDSDWTIQRHPVSGAIVSRVINTTVAMKKADGNCRMFVISFEQPYSGNKYGKARQFGVGDSADISCDKVK
ncbi:MAG: hypothetical protein WBQ23_16930 [Bacteroidota bacterium]